MKCCPDTGATQTVIHERIARQAGLVSQNCNEQYHWSDGHSGGGQRSAEVRRLETYHICIDCQGYGLHLPLEGIFAKALYDIPNPRLQRLREKLVEYNFTVTWVPGKSHHIADALSRAPLFSPEETDDMYIDSARAYMTQVPAMEQELNSVLDSIDSDYVKLRQDVLNGTIHSTYSHQLKSVFGQLSVDDELVYLNAKRIVLPLKTVKDVLKMAHLPHAGITKTYELLRSLYFWPGMYNDVKQLISACGPCTRNVRIRVRVFTQESQIYGSSIGSFRPSHGLCWGRFNQLRGQKSPSMC